MAHKHTPAVHSTLSNYIEFINKEVIEHYGKSYMTPENTRNKWRNEIEPSAQTEEFLISKSKLFLDMMDSRDSKSTNPAFLKSLINEISDYLSKYFMRGKNITRNQTTKQIKEILWDNNRHIQHLLTTQQQRHDAANKKTYKNKQKKQERIMHAKRDYEIKKQVQTLFQDIYNHR